MRLHAFYATGRYGAPASRPGGIAIGVAISIVLHLMLLYGTRLNREARPNATAPPETITVWLRPVPVVQPLPPPPAPLTAESEAPPPKKQVKERAPRKPAPANAPAAPAKVAEPGMTWVAPAPAQPASADPFAEPAATPPRFDMDAARRAARKVASERDPAKAGTAVGQFPEKPLASETPLARSISRSARADCKDGIPGGLLAPALLLMDKKDHGCKW
ncbi:hypothetical protein LJR289_004804 [Pseudoduganella sp. LjRoot289]|uniref:hypothetical protein n=1 Tax=Pseudoduganella sp. LjRoot289 TaxID=3342314 RepID=UPI003ECC7997